MTDRYIELNNEFRAKLNAATITYQGNQMPIVFGGDISAGQGAFLYCRLITNDPVPQEVGEFTIEEITGYYQVDIYIPSTDQGIDYSQHDVASQISALFPRVRFGANVSIIPVGTGSNEGLRVEGSWVKSVRVNFRVKVCAEV